MSRFEPFLNVFFAIFWVAIFICWLAGIVKPYSAFTWAGIGAGVTGWLIMLVAKWPQVRKGDVFSFGASGLPVTNQRLYKMSYLALLLGVSLLITSHFTDFLNMEIVTDPMYQSSPLDE